MQPDLVREARTLRRAFRAVLWPPKAERWRTLVAGWLLTERAAWRLAFAQAAAQIVLLRLSRLCHATTTTHVVGDATGSAQLEGRRQVWLFIQAQLRLTEDQLEAMRLAAQQGED